MKEAEAALQIFGVDPQGTLKGQRILGKLVISVWEVMSFAGSVEEVCTHDHVMMGQDEVGCKSAAQLAYCFH